MEEIETREDIYELIDAGIENYNYNKFNIPYAEAWFKDLFRLYFTTSEEAPGTNIVVPASTGIYSGDNYPEIIDTVYCDYTKLEKICQRCGCPQGTTCQDYGSCDTKCTDGTPYGQCATTQPKYCDNGILINNCQKRILK